MVRSELIQAAVDASYKAYPHISGTHVGCAIQTTKGGVFAGANIEGQFQTSIHAEVAAITKMVNADFHNRIAHIVVVSPCSMFTPCGACLDWIYQFMADGADLIVVKITGGVWEVVGQPILLNELYPKYPMR